MALLYYHNLGLRRPDILMRNVFFGLKTYYDFLRKTQGYMESDAAVKRLAWRSDHSAETGEGAASNPVWVVLEEPKDHPNEPESTFKAFMDENIREIYETSPEAQRRNNRHRFDEKHKIAVLGRDPETSRLKLERHPADNAALLLRPNTYTLSRQIRALQALQNKPSLSHLPLLRLMESEGHAYWPSFNPTGVEDWMVLTDPDRPGTQEQREFVQIAMGTPDFALLEGPPGSGKTTAICELILQLVKKGQRVLLCASTHVAVDNVLERLMDERNDYHDHIIPIRIGERNNISKKARPWQLGTFARTERNRLLQKLGELPLLSKAQTALRDSIRHAPSMIERMVLAASNLVCGTTIGILQHPDIKKQGAATASYDVLIIDEASKTTFQEFLVPALLSKKWVIVGDPKQLSPYVDVAEMAVNVKACLPDESLQNACVDVFRASQPGKKQRRVAAVVTEKEQDRKAYIAQADAHGVELVDAADSKPLWGASLVVGTLTDFDRRLDELPLDVTTVRAPDDALDLLRRRAAAFLQISKRGREQQPQWADEISWRLASVYEQRFSQEPDSQAGKGLSTNKRLHQQIKALLPVEARERDVADKIDRVRCVALPSILESLRHGFEQDEKQRKSSALTDGLPEHALAQRHIILSTQHRMHPEIAAFSHEHIYARKALTTPKYMEQTRAWAYARYDHRSLWLDVRGGFKGRSNANVNEASKVVGELKHFDTWAKNNPCADGQPWEAAVLTFYRGQEREIRHQLRCWSKQSHAMRHFTSGSHLSIELCTVDRFQGHEADLVILSFASAWPTSFLESPNRLNVALTRARYQRVIVGDRLAMQKSKADVLRSLAENEPWDRHIEKENCS